MKDIEKKLRAGMGKQGIAPDIQDKIVRSITSFALYGFPESHAASFALIAYASAYLKCHYLAAFTAAILNNQPMGFYSAATLVKDAQRHGLKIKPIDVATSDWKCTLERVVAPPASQQIDLKNTFALRLGLNFVRGLRAEIASEIVRQRAIRSFTSVDDLKLCIPVIQKAELTALAEIGALNSIAGKSAHRRSALWQIERVARPVGPLLESPLTSEIPLSDSDSPLTPMTPEERLVSDFRGTGLTVGLHPMAHHRATLKRRGIRSAVELRALPDGTRVRIAGAVIARQRPGTAKGFVFLSIEDETGIANAIITPRIFTQNRIVVVNQQFLLIDGVLQNQDNLISVKAQCIRPLTLTRAAASPHDFH
jgi:error-prone DNA polymerase